MMVTLAGQEFELTQIVRWTSSPEIGDHVRAILAHRNERGTRVSFSASLDSLQPTVPVKRTFRPGDRVYLNGRRGTFMSYVRPTETQPIYACVLHVTEPYFSHTVRRVALARLVLENLNTEGVL